jgi:LacI family transcriptional regulator
MVDASSDDPSISSVVPDELGGALTAVRELAAHGHRAIGFLNNEDDIPATHLRLAGYRRGLEEIGAHFDTNMVIADRSDAAAGYRSGTKLLDRLDRPTAVFCFNDRMAMGTYQAAADLGLRIPQDLSIVGFDNQESIADGLRPGLTTLALPHYEMGQWAVRTLIDLVDSRAHQPAPQAMTLSCPLVRRASVGPPPVRSVDNARRRDTWPASAGHSQSGTSGHQSIGGLRGSAHPQTPRSGRFGCCAGTIPGRVRQGRQ